MLREFTKTLFQVLGNKRYLCTLEKMFQDKLSDILPEEKRALRYLIQDLNELKRRANKPNKYF